MKDEGVVDPNAVMRWLKKFHLGYKNLDDQVRSDRFKIMDSEAVL